MGGGVSKNGIRRVTKKKGEILEGLTWCEREDLGRVELTWKGDIGRVKLFFF